MIFFGKDIINKIIDTSEMEELEEKVEQFNSDVEMIFTYFSYPNIDIKYVQNLLKYKTNQTAFYCMDTEFNIRSCPTCMIYSKQNKKNSDTIYYYIMMICTQQRFKKLGYASMLLDDFVKTVRNETKDETKSVKIVLSSVDEAVSYYQRYGFEAVDYRLESYPYLLKFEKCEPDKLYTVMELQISTRASPF
jgi:ribosomal protein S18 acetylase RimI-like enzyme